MFMGVLREGWDRPPSEATTDPPAGEATPADAATSLSATQFSRTNREARALPFCGVASLLRSLPANPGRCVGRVAAYPLRDRADGTQRPGLGIGSGDTESLFDLHHGFNAFKLAGNILLRGVSSTP